MDGAASWLKRIVITRIMLNSLGADMTAMQEYFLLVSKAFTVMQYCFCHPVPDNRLAAIQGVRRAYH